MLKNWNKIFIIPIALSLFIFNNDKAQANECTAFSGNGINNWYPFSYRTDDGKLTGIMVDGMQQALQRMGLKLEIQEDRPWKRIMYDLEKSQVDMVLGAYWNKERAKKFIFSEQMGTDELRVFVKSGNEFPFDTFADLIGRTGTHLLGGSLGDNFDNFARKYLDFTETPKSNIIISMLHKERVDYGILGYIEGLKFIHSAGLTNQIVALPKPILSNAMHVLISKNAPCASRIQELNQTLTEMKRDGSLDKITNHHLSLIAQYSG